MDFWGEYRVQPDKNHPPASSTNPHSSLTPPASTRGLTLAQYSGIGGIRASVWGCTGPFLALHASHTGKSSSFAALLQIAGSKFFLSANLSQAPVGHFGTYFSGCSPCLSMSLLRVPIQTPRGPRRKWGGSGSNRRLPDYESSKPPDAGVLTLPEMDSFPRGIANPQDWSGHA